jgi:single-stranded-DNA-specific exonuclease
MLEPYGTDNKKPLFAQKDLYICGVRELGSTGRTLKLFLKDDKGYPVEAIYFGDIAAFYQAVVDAAGERELLQMKQGQRHHVGITCTYYPEINEWTGCRTIQIIIKNYKIILLKS